MIYCIHRYNTSLWGGKPYVRTEAKDRFAAIPYNRCLIQFKHLAENRDPFFSDIRVHINDSLAFSVDVNSASGIIIIWLATLYWLDIRPEQPVIVGIARLCHTCRRSLPEWKCEQFSSDNPKHAPVHIITLKDKEYEEFQQYIYNKVHGYIWTPDTLELICGGNDNDPARIGRQILEMAGRLKNEHISHMTSDKRRRYIIRSLRKDEIHLLQDFL